MEAPQIHAPDRRSYRRWWQRLVQGARLCCGVPDYDNYVRHLRERHPERPIPDYATFFRERQHARYAGGRSGCCQRAIAR